MSLEQPSTFGLAPLRLPFEDDGGNICKLCKQEFGNQTAISTINRHFQNFHLAEFTKISQHKSRRLDPYGPNNKYKVDILNNKLLKWVVVNQQSFLLAKNAEFNNFLKKLDPCYRLPCQQTLSTWVGQDYIKNKNKIKFFLNTIQSKISITIDGWTSCTQQPYITVTAHWVNSDWKMNRILLDLIPFNEIHTAINQSDTIIEILKKMDFGQKLLGIMIDNAANRIAMGRILKEKISNEFASNQTLKPSYPNDQEWNIIVVILEPIYHATVMLSSSTLLTQGDHRIVFCSLIMHLNNNENPKVNTQHVVVSAMKTKFASYCVHLNKSSTILGLLDPHNKLSTYVVNEREQAINMLYKVYENYKPAEENKLPSQLATKSMREILSEGVSEAGEE
ncbi:5787_t:CDS:2, partial [Cetraspora pellucida]